MSKQDNTAKQTVSVYVRPEVAMWYQNEARRQNNTISRIAGGVLEDAMRREERRRARRKVIPRQAEAMAA